MDIVRTSFEENREKIQSPMGMMAIGMIIVLIIATYYFFIRQRNPEYIELIKDQVLASRPNINTNSDSPHPNAYTFDKSLCPLSRNGVEFGYSFWIYVQAWEDSNYEKPKSIMIRGDPNHAAYSGPSIWINPITSELVVILDVFDIENATDHIITLEDVYNFIGKEEDCLNGMFKCKTSEIHLQKWIHVAVVLNDMTLDIFVNGKLVKSCVLEFRPRLSEADLSIGGIKVNPESDAHTGFIGYISRFIYYSRNISPIEVYNHYKKGPHPLDNIFTRLYKSIKLGFNPNSEASKFAGLVKNSKDCD